MPDEHEREKMSTCLRDIVVIKLLLLFQLKYVFLKLIADIVVDN